MESQKIDWTENSLLVDPKDRQPKEPITVPSEQAMMEQLYEEEDQ